ncbi:MAG: peptidylprolyl isomerase [Pseudomonadales bacterium]|nr:peptidylprolyl isomerase [Pseudomonadales bacterium]
MASEEPVSADTVRVQTTLGTFYLALLESETPLTVANFKSYIDSGAYLETILHRSVAGFILQGGGFSIDAETLQPRAIALAAPIINEFSRSNRQGTVAMAKMAGDPDSATNQWFINLADNSDNLDFQNGGFTVFAAVIKGMEVIGAIAALPTHNLGGNFSTTPLTRFDGVNLGADNFITIDQISYHRAVTAPFSAVLPGSRSVEIGQLATAFAAIINTGDSAAIGCSIQPPAEFAGEFFFQATNSIDNTLVGEPNELLAIEAGAVQTTLIGLTSREPLAGSDLRLSYTCLNSNPALSLSGINTFILSASAQRVPDIIALAATPLSDGIVHLPATMGTGVFAIAIINVGAAAEIFVNARFTDAEIPVFISLCETDRLTAVCIKPSFPAAEAVMLDIAENDTRTFSVFITGEGIPVGLDPAKRRIVVEFTDQQGNLRGATSVAIDSPGDDRIIVSNGEYFFVEASIETATTLISTAEPGVPLDQYTPRIAIGPYSGAVQAIINTGSDYIIADDYTVYLADNGSVNDTGKPVSGLRIWSTDDVNQKITRLTFNNNGLQIVLSDEVGDETIIELPADALQPANCDAALALNDDFVSGTSYWGSNDWIEYRAGSLPIILASPHGGQLEPEQVPVFNNGLASDARSQEYTLATANAIFAATGQHPHIILNHLKRNRLNLNRSKADDHFDNVLAMQAWDEFHGFVETAKAWISQACQKGIYFDLHTSGSDHGHNEVAFLLDSAALSLTDEALAGLAAETSLRKLLVAPGLTLSGVSKGPLSLGSLLHVVEAMNTIPNASIGLDNPLTDYSYFTGGYNTRTHGSLTGGVIDAIQIESHFSFVNSSTDNDSKRAAYSVALARSMVEFVERWYGFQLTQEGQ